MWKPLYNIDEYDEQRSQDPDMVIYYNNCRRIYYFLDVFVTFYPRYGLSSYFGNLYFQVLGDIMEDSLEIALENIEF